MGRNDEQTAASPLEEARVATNLKPLSTIAHDLVEPTATKVTKVAEEVAGPMYGKLNVTWRDCGDSQTIENVTGLSLSVLKLGSISTLGGYGVLSKAVEGGNFTIKMMAGIVGITLVDVTGDMCQKQDPVGTLLDLIHINWDGVECPMEAGTRSWQVRLRLSELIPPYIAQTTTTILARSKTGEKVFCMEVSTDRYRTEYSPDVLI